MPSLAQRELNRTGLIERIRSAKIVDPEKYLAVFEKLPQLEKFSKANLPRLVKHCLSDQYSPGKFILVPQTTSLTRMLGIDAQQLKRLRQSDGNPKILAWLQLEKSTGRTIPDDPNGTVRQKRTKYNRQEADVKDVAKFLMKWQKIVANRLTNEDRTLAKSSLLLRNQEYAKLRDEQVMIHVGDLAGSLLVDVLTADLMEMAA